MSLETLFNPRSLAVIGASNNPEKLGAQILQNIKTGGWRGALYPVNLTDAEIFGLKAYKKITAVGKPVDLAIIVIPAPYVLEEVKNCAAAKVKNIIIISAGFGEINEAGKKIEAEIRKIASRNRINVLGPNCLGLINTGANLNATFAKFTPDSKTPRKNNIAFISQSGAIGAAVLDWVAGKNIGFSYFVSLGNKTVLDENDFLEYLINDKPTELVAAYLEDIIAGGRFMALASRLAKVKPLAILKAGRTAAGGAAAKSHTGSLAGDAAVFLAGLKRAGAIVLDDMTELFDLLRLIKKPYKLNDYSLSIISNAGGPLVLSVDEAVFDGLDLKYHEDILGDARSDKYYQAIGDLLVKKKVNNLLVLLTPQAVTEVEKTAAVIGEFAKKYPEKLICTSFIGGAAVAEGKKVLAKYMVPNYDFPEQALKVLGHYLRYQKNLKTLMPYKYQEQSQTAGSGRCLDYLESLALLKKYKIPTAAAAKYPLLPAKTAKLISTAKMVKTTATAVKFPLVLKIVGPEIIHKTEAQAIFYPVADAAAAQKILAGSPLLKDKKNYAVAQELVARGQEIIVGFRRDKFFGPIIMVGQGGIYTEIFKDVQLEIADLDKKRALDMIKSLKIYPILAGARGGKGFDINSLAAVILQTAKIANEHPEISELDINPLFLKNRGAAAADVRIII